MRKALFAIGFAAAMIPAMALPASAGPPTVSTFHNEGTDVPVEDCGSFTVLLSFSHDETITTFYDKAASPIREQIRFNFSGTLTNSVTGKTAYEVGDSTVIIDLTNGETQTVGLVLLVRLPGFGVATLEIGHVVFESGTITEVDSLQVLDGGDSSFCSLLS
jgi:hypothetical protein